LSFSAVCYRSTGYEVPLWAFPNTVAGRYNPANSWPAQYLALHPMTPWAEQLRNLDLRTPVEGRCMRIPLWAVRLELSDEPARIGFGDAARYGVEPADLVDDDRSECRRLAGALRGAGTRSIIVPSAALPGTENLVVFEPAAVIDYHQEPIDPEDIPSALTGQDGRCPETLWDHVHFLAAGVAHPALQAYIDGADFELVQPPVSAASPAVA
jgi:RES domain-containing protein